MTISSHLLSRWGAPIEQVRIVLPNGRELEMARFLDVPCRDATTVLTLDAATMRTKGKDTALEEEFVLSCYARFFVEDAYKLLGTIIQQAIDTKRILWGDVLGPAGAILPTTPMEALFAYAPVYHREALLADTGAPGRFVWLVPIHAREAAFARAGHALAAEFEASDPDLLDWTRPSLV